MNTQGYNYFKDPSSGGGQIIFDAIVNADGSGDYESIAEALDAGEKNIYIKNGTYLMTGATVLTNECQLVGESPNGVILDFQADSNNYIIGTGSNSSTYDELFYKHQATAKQRIFPVSS